MISRACIDPSAGCGHKLVDRVWHTHIFQFPHSIGFDFDHFRRLATCVTNTVPLSESRPSRLFGLIISRNMTCISRPPFIAYHYSFLCLTQDLSLILALRCIRYSSSPICQTRSLWLWMHLEFKHKTRRSFTFCGSPCNFSQFSQYLVALERGWQLDSMRYSIRILIRSAIEASLWSDEHFGAKMFWMRKVHMKQKSNHLLFIVSSGGTPLWNCICLLPSSSTSLNSPCWIQCLNR